MTDPVDILIRLEACDSAAEVDVVTSDPDFAFALLEKPILAECAALARKAMVMHGKLRRAAATYAMLNLVGERDAALWMAWRARRMTK